MPNSPQKLLKRQVDLGPDLDGFTVDARSPADNMVDVAAGVFNNPSDKEIYFMAAQTAGPLAVVTGALRVRWDLIYLDSVGVPQVEAGTEQAAGVPDYTGAPGNGAATTIDDAWPLAWVMVDEAGGVVIDITDITLIRGFSRNREIGLVGALATDNQAGAPGIRGTNFNLAPIDHQHPPSVDAVNPADVALVANPGALFLYARRDHIHKIDATLLASLQMPMAQSTTCLWTPRSHVAAANPLTEKWVLHKFQARAINNANVWFNVNTGTEETCELWQTDNGSGNPAGPNVLPGEADETDPTRAALHNGWVYVYIIGNSSTGAAACVYSTSVPSTGPIAGPAINGGVNAAFTGYDSWRLVTCIEIDNAGNPVAARKYDNLVLKDYFTGMNLAGNNVATHAEDLFWNANFGNVVSAAEHCSPIALQMLVNYWALAKENTGIASIDIEIFTDALVAPGMQAKPAGSPATSYFKKLHVESPTGGGYTNHVYDSFWIPLTANRTFYVNVVVVNGTSVALPVQGYLEVFDIEVANLDFEP